jgi:hypothetical protein
MNKQELNARLREFEAENRELKDTIRELRAKLAIADTGRPVDWENHRPCRAVATADFRLTHGQYPGEVIEIEMGEKLDSDRFYNLDTMLDSGLYPLEGTTEGQQAEPDIEPEGEKG